MPMVENDKIEWLENEKGPGAHFCFDGREYYLLNNSIEVMIGGVLYRVRSIYGGKDFMGDVLDALTMEKINRTVA